MDSSFGTYQAERTQWGAKRRIALVGLSLFDDETPELRSALHRFLSTRSDWRVVFASEAYTEAIQLLQKIPCDGVLARIVTAAMAEEARMLTCPVVNISSLLEEPGVPTVRRDDRYQGSLCAQHLLNQGFERFGIVQETLSDWCFRAAEQGFMAKLHEQKRQLSVSPFALNLSHAEMGDFSEFSRWLRSLKPPFGLFLVGDLFASELMNICQKEGFRIPSDVALISSAGHAELLRKCKPTLTHCEPDGDWLIRPACEHLEELMQNPGQVPRCVNIRGPGLILGDSTNTLAVDDSQVRKALEFIEASFQTGIDVGDVAKQINCGRRLLEVRFKKALGTSVLGHLTEKRIRFAKGLMEADPSEKLLNIASRSGFREMQTFRASFFRVTGKTPSQWRAELGTRNVA